MIGRKAILISTVLVLASSFSYAQDKKVTLKLSYWVPPSHLLTPGYKDWADSVKEASNGSITVTMFPSSQLGSANDHYDMVKRGIADFGLINPGYTPGRFPVIGVVDLPFTSVNSAKASPAMTRWYKKYAEKEMPDIMVCHVFSHEPGTVHSKKKIQVPADVKGLNLRTGPQAMANYVTSMGGNSIQVPVMEAFETLKRGLADGLMVTWDALTHPAFKFGQVTEYSLDAPLFTSSFVHGINRAAYDGMSDAQKKVINDHCTPEWSARVYKYWNEDLVKREDEIRKSDRKITKINPAEVDEWRRAAEPVVATWKEATSKAGQAADAVLEEYRASLKEVGSLF
jgi:TRAP-type C4-dicarboxylate transport system substrate-binding protein